MGGFGGKGGQMGGMSDLQRLAPNMQGDGASYQDYVNRPTQEIKMSEAQFNAQRGGMGGKGGNINQVGPNGMPIGAPGFSGFSGMNKMGGMGGKGGQEPVRDLGFGNGPGNIPKAQYAGGMGGKGGQMPRRDMGYGNGPRGVIKNYGNVLRGQQSGLAALAQPTATTQAATPAPEQPYMGNYLS
jgi:hypothetical protein